VVPQPTFHQARLTPFGTEKALFFWLARPCLQQVRRRAGGVFPLEVTSVTVTRVGMNFRTPLPARIRTHAGAGAMIASRIAWFSGVLFSFGWVCSACGGTSANPAIKSNHTPVCDPGSRRCEGDAIKRCNQTGTGDSFEMACAPGQCRVQGNNAFCSPPVIPMVCMANQPMCDRNSATQCKADGSGPQPGGVDCGATTQHCLEGACSDSLCVGATRSCHDGDVYVCSADGASLSVWDDCADSEVCDEVSSLCLARVCEPSKTTCLGTRVVTCNASGSGWLPDPTDCAAQGNRCVAGTCQKNACAASTTFCQDGNVYQCDPSGASSALSRTCRPGVEHCEVTPAGLYAFCIPYACVAGQKLCDGDVVKTCNSDNTIPPDGTACARDEVCEDAACKPLGCHLDTFFCKGKDVYFCGHDGQALNEECASGQACGAIIANPDPNLTGNFALAGCMPSACPPGETGCVLDKIGSCGADGTSLSAVTNDCAASGKICTRNAMCDVSVTDTVGLDKSVAAISEDQYLGNVIDVRSTRKLTELQMWLVFPSTRSIRWLVFELVGYEFVPRVEKTTSVPSSTGFVSSGALSFSYQLEAGKRYALGVIVSGSSIGYYDDTVPLPLAESPSFGTVNGVVSAFSDVASFNIVDSFTGSVAALMKVTTTTP